jgi:hypothetical protein
MSRLLNIASLDLFQLLVGILCNAVGMTFAGSDRTPAHRARMALASRFRWPATTITAQMDVSQAPQLARLAQLTQAGPPA